MKNIKAVLGVLLIFILGAASGIVATRMIYHSRLDAAMGGGQKAHEEMVVKRLTRKLDLNDQQREQVRSIVHETQGEIKLVRKQSQPQIETILAKSQAKINRLLTPEQQEKFARVIAERKARRANDN